VAFQSGVTGLTCEAAAIQGTAMAGIRLARIEDAAAIAAIEVETWRTTYAGMLADATLVGLSVERKTWQWASELRRRGSGTVWVWEDDDGTLLGFGECGRQRLPSLPYEGEIAALYVLPDAQGRGIGRQLMLAMFSDLRRQGLRSALVWVLAANPSRYFYERMGGKSVLRRRIAVGGHPVEATGYGWIDVAATLQRSGP